MGDTVASSVAGSVADGFELVRHTFQDNFKRHDELGAAFAVTHKGELVVDLWGGVADEATARPWRHDTLQVIFSGTKALVALCMLMLVDRGQLDLKAPVHRYWAEFATKGKGGVTVLDLTAHRARLPGFRVALEHDELIDDRRMAALLASQPMESDSRAANVYHPLTFGWLCGEVVRRVDGRSVGRFFHEEVAAPLGLELWIGLPGELEGRVSTIRYDASWGWPPWDLDALADDSLLHRVWNNPPLFPADQAPWNERAWHGAELPGAGAIGTARSIARLYGCLALGGELEGVRLLTPQTLALGCREVSRRWEPLLNEPQVFGVGFQRQTERQPFGPPWDAFGHPGAGGSVHCAWPSQGVGLSYTMNSLRDDDLGDPRAHALLHSVYDVVKRRGARP